jgi:hypothetical protein
MVLLQEFQAMKRHLWERCAYYPDGRCPNRSLINRAYLIPQVLSPSALAAIETACANCEVCRQDRREYRRVQRPLDAVILDKQSAEELHGRTLNVSERGALIEIGSCDRLQVNQKIELRLYDGSGSCHSSRGVLKRIERTRGAISVFFLVESKKAFMKRDGRSIGFIMHPASYPAARLILTQKIQDGDDKYGRRIFLDREFWIDFANICKRAISRVGDIDSQILRIALNSISSMIMDEMAAEDKRTKYREIYGSFLDFVVAVMGRTDLDKARKGQIIHDKACLIKLL